MIGAASRAAIVVVATIALATAARGEPAQAEEEAAAEPDDCGEPKRLDGIDVSSWQGEIDWRRVHRAGIAFAFARVSNGLDADERFAENFAGMRRAHVRRHRHAPAGICCQPQVDRLGLSRDAPP